MDPLTAGIVSPQAASLKDSIQIRRVAANVIKNLEMTASGNISRTFSPLSFLLSHLHISAKDLEWKTLSSYVGPQLEPHREESELLLLNCQLFLRP